MLKHVLLASVLIAAPASAETLAEAIAAAYQTNPTIGAARAQLRQTDEAVPIAAAGMRPKLDLTGDFTQQLTHDVRSAGQLWRGGVALRQPIYQGGRVRAGISAAEAQIAAQRARLRATEYQVIVDTATAYADVLKTDALVTLNEGQEQLLIQQLRASQDRFQVGDLTRTDVAQSEAALAQARAGLQGARAQRTLARQAYRRLVGHDPVDLQPLPALTRLPDTDEEARNRASDGNANLAAARFAEKAAGENVRVAKAGHGPSVALNAGALYVHGTDTVAALTGFTPSLGVTASMPLFSGGLIPAQVRQAQAAQSQALENITYAERTAVEAATDYFGLLRTSEALIESAKAQISANALAAEGVKQENLVGSRDVLDVLNAEQLLLNSRVSLVQAERDRYVNAYNLYMVMGALEDVLDGAPIGRYDVEANAKRVRGKGWQEFGYDPDPQKDRTRNQAPPLVGPRQ